MHLTMPVTIFAPGSMAPVREAIVGGFRGVAPDVEVRFYPPAYSGLLARQIAEGGAADVFISASWNYVADLQRAGFVPRPHVLAGNRLCVTARPEIAPEIVGVADLAREGLRLLVPPAENNPLGQYTALLFARAGLAEAMAKKRERGEIREQLASLRDWLESGEIDAAVMYASGASVMGRAASIPLPESLDLHETIVFGVGAAVPGGVEHPGAERLVQFLLSDPGQAILTRGGFLPKSAVSRATLTNA